TSVGMTPNVDKSPLPPHALRADTVVLDTVYTPEQTRLLQDASVAGCVTVTGVEMFLRQAREQIRLWHGREVPLDDFTTN
ncbi:MAG: shikimate dehydrogenase, partial [Phycisphaerae bacterium]